MGFDAEAGRVRLADFVHALESASAALKRADEIVAGMPTLYLRILRLSSSSPALAELEVVVRQKKPDYRDEALNVIRKTLTALQSPNIPRGIDYELLERLREFGSPVGDKIEAATLAVDDTIFEFSKGYVRRIEDALEPHDSCIGTVDGALEQINVHAGTNTFTIYPVAGPTRLTCKFRQHMRHVAIAAIGRRVAVTGTLHYHRDAPYPHEIDVESLEIYPPVEELASFESLRGRAPDATGDLSSEEFIRELRCDW